MRVPTEARSVRSSWSQRYVVVSHLVYVLNIELVSSGRVVCTLNCLPAQTHNSLMPGLPMDENKNIKTEISFPSQWCSWVLTCDPTTEEAQGLQLFGTLFQEAKQKAKIANNKRKLVP